MATMNPLHSNAFTRYPPMEEQEWVIHILETIKETKENIRTSVSIFSVPKPLLSSKPEAYTPQLFAIGPYHHWEPQLYEMQSYKLATAKRTQRQFRNIKLQQLVDNFLEHEHEIRSYYHRQLDIKGSTLAWVMAIDASFLLEFLRNYCDVEGRAFRRVPSMSHMVDSKRIKFAYNSIIKDVVMLENQIPLFLLRRILYFQSLSEKEADAQLSKMLVGFVTEVSPFKLLELSKRLDVKKFAHLLGLLYCMIVPRNDEDQETDEIYLIPFDNPEENPKEDFGDDSCIKNLLTEAWSSITGEGMVVEFVKKVLVAKPMQFLSKLPLGSVIKGSLLSVLRFRVGDKNDDKDSSNSINKPPLVEEILVPSVTELVRAGVKFLATNQDLTTIKFDVKTATFYLPEITLDCNTEVVLRNLVAYESSVEAGPMVFTRYTELMNGIIDTDEDVKLLRKCKVIKNRMKSDKEVADLWNEMMKSVRLTKVPFIDKALEDVNKYYNGRMSVKLGKFMKKYILGSWQILTLLAAVLLLMLTCVQAFCTVYNCRLGWL
ncbi:hypothetical protein IHE45_08G113200 [Dioscorea alata]|uniref:Uncharacterized protein n=1 Tax=Dioscorea alata TaxID=55571 RepID=A0ACB7VLI3_DIOAL|nr:hypothetical protein IHE45_08G113200 [Dioscorea alata]